MTDKAGRRPSPSRFRTQWEVCEVFLAETMKKQGFCFAQRCCGPSFSVLSQVAVRWQKTEPERHWANPAMLCVIFGLSFVY